VEVVNYTQGVRVELDESLRNTRSPFDPRVFRVPEYSAKKGAKGVAKDPSPSSSSARMRQDKVNCSPRIFELPAVRKGEGEG